MATAVQAQDNVATAVTVDIPGVVTAGTPIELIKEGFTGTEGPIAFADGSLLFTETQANRITRIASDGSTSTFLEASNGANGLGFDTKGQLYAAQVQNPRVGIIYPAQSAKVLADNFEGAPFVRPNDLVVDRKGNVYFTDSGRAPNQAAPQQAALQPTAAPGVNAGELAQKEPAKPAVYRINAQGQLQRLAADIERPNGIQLSPDERVLYVANTAGEYLLAYSIREDGSVGARRNFAKLQGFRQTENGPTSGADGIAVDAQGRVYVASTAGIQIFTDRGEPLGVIALPKAPQNIAFAGANKKTLYAVGRGAAYRITTQTAGFEGRAK